VRMNFALDRHDRGAEDGVGSQRPATTALQRPQSELQRIALPVAGGQIDARAGARAVACGAEPVARRARAASHHGGSAAVSREFFAGGKKLYVGEEDARALLEKFPGSTLKPLALASYQFGMEQRRYRTVVESARSGRGSAAGRLGEWKASARAIEPARGRSVVSGEGFSQCGRRLCRGVARSAAWCENGELMFQRRAVRNRSGLAGAAQSVLDELERSPAFTAENRWEAEWNLARALLGRGTPETVKAAYARVNRLLAGQTPELTPELRALRARMKWMQARLAFETGDARGALDLATKDLPALSQGLEPGLKNEIEAPPLC